MSNVAPGDSIVLLFATEDQDGSAVAATGAPTAQLIQNGVADGAVTVSITNISVGVEQASFTIPGTYAASDEVQLEVSYLAGTRTAIEYIWERTLTLNPVAGAGADNVTITILDPATLFPVADADVWISSDLAGLNVVAGTLQTDGAGQVLFLLDDGVTYYLWMQKEGQKSIRGKEFIAVAD
jgi:hypothetical protein